MCFCFCLFIHISHTIQNMYNFALRQVHVNRRVGPPVFPPLPAWPWWSGGVQTPWWPPAAAPRSRCRGAPPPLCTLLLSSSECSRSRVQVRRWGRTSSEGAQVKRTFTLLPAWQSATSSYPPMMMTELMTTHE